MLAVGIALACASSAVAKPVSAWQSDPADALTQLRNGLAEMVSQGELPNAQVAILKGGKEITRFSLGKADLETGKPLPKDAIFRLYSMTKPITSVAAMMLVEDGRIAIDAPVERYIPELAGLRVYTSGTLNDMVTVPTSRPITIGDLLTHSSGITYNFMGNTPVHQYYRRHGVMRSGGVGRGRAKAPLRA